MRKWTTRFGATTSSAHASLEEKARQTLEMMRTGVRLKRAGLRARFPAATPEEIEAMVQRWLDRDD